MKLYKNIKINIFLILFIISDIISFYIGFFVAYFIRKNVLIYFFKNLVNVPDINFYFQFNYLVFLFIGLLIYNNLYFLKRELWSEFGRIIKSTLFWVILSFTLLAIMKNINEVSRFILILTGFSSIFIVILFRIVIKFILFKLNFWKTKSAILTGSLKNLNSIKNTIKGINKDWYSGYNISAIIIHNSKKLNVKLDNLNVINIKSIKKDNIYKILTTYKIEELFVYNVDDRLLEKIIIFNDEKIVHVNYIPSFHYIKVFNIKTQNIGNMLTLVLRNNLASLVHLIQKWTFDLLVSITIIFLLLPFFLIVSILIKITSKGPLFYYARRIGKNYEPINICKFRTMYHDAEKRLKTLLNSDKKLKKEFEKKFKLRNDPRITKVGKLLRKFSIDEFPQLLNVLKLELSLVGPRPIVKDEIKKYGEHFDEVIKVRPGITGLWQVSGRNDIDYNDRVQLDLFYIRNWSIWLDIKILFKTIPALIKGRGAY